MKNFRSSFITLAALAQLTACSLPNFNMLGMSYKPMNSELAEIAVPMPPPDAPIDPKEKPLYCAVAKGTAKFDNDWSAFSRQEFQLLHSGRTGVRISSTDNGHGMKFQSYFDADGQKLIFCPVVSGPANKKIACASIYALDDDLKDGIKRTFDIPDAIRGGEITCAYSKAAFRKL